MGKMVYGQNGVGQNSTDKMVGLLGKMIRTKWYWAKWYGQNGMQKMVQFYILSTF